MTEFKYRILEEDAGLDIKTLLRRKFDFSSRFRAKIKREKLVKLNGELVDGWIKPDIGDLMTIGIVEEKSAFTPQDIPLSIVYEDDSLLVLNKQPGIVVHPTGGHPLGTLSNGIMKYMLDTHQSFKIRFVNRLDMDTSGLIVIAKNAHSQADFMKQSQAGKVEKRYIAVVKGLMKDNCGTIDLPIGRPEGQVRREVMEDGQPSITHYSVVKRFDSGYTLVELLLETGRTHQIRVHLTHLGHPIVGDHLYGGGNAFLIERQALHAKHLAFRHPVTGEDLELDAALPRDMAALLASL